MVKQTLKGVLLSGLVFPGLGQVALKRYRRGFVWMLLVLVALIAMVSALVRQASVILDKIGAQGGIVDLNYISNAAAQVTETTDGIVINVAFVLIVVLWGAGIIDAFLIGRQLDAAQPSVPRISTD